MNMIVLHPGAVGDFLLALPALRALRSTYPDEAIVWIAQPSILRLFSESGLYDKGISIDSASAALLFSDSFLRHDFPVESVGAAVAWLKDRDGSLSRNLRALGADPLIIGRPLSDPSPKHRSDLFFDSLRPLQVRSDYSGRFSSWEEKLREEGMNLLGKSGIPPPVVLHPGAGSPRKRWPPSQFARLGDRISSQSCPVLLLEGPAEEGLAESVSEQMSEKVLVVSGLDLKTAAGLLSASRGFVGNDSGMTHLAAAMGVPTLALFKETDPDHWRPRGERVWVETDPHRLDDTLAHFQSLL
jgi:heptosyltransferase-3